MAVQTDHFAPIAATLKATVRAAPLLSLEEDIELNRVRPISELIKTREALPPDMARTVYESAVSSIETASTPQLLIRLETATDPAVCWHIHRALTTRNVPPSVRTRPGEESRQFAFLAVAADVFWIATHHPGRIALFERAQGVFKYEAGSEQWHKSMAYVYRLSAGRPHRVAVALALSDADRCLLDTMATKAQNAARKAIRTAHRTIEDDLTEYATAHPDKTGRVTPEDVVRHRLLILRYFVLCGRDPSVTADCLTRTANLPIERRQVALRIAQVKARSAAADRALALRI